MPRGGPPRFFLPPRPFSAVSRFYASEEVAGAARRAFPEGAVTQSARSRGGAAGAGFRAASCIIVAPRAAVWAKKRTFASGNGRTNGLWTRLRREFWWA